jgi:hypothetical protein
VATVLKAAQENLDRKSILRSMGYDFDWLVACSAYSILLTTNQRPPAAGGMRKAPRRGQGLAWSLIFDWWRQRKMVQARSVLCYGGTRELGMSAVWISS